LNWYVYAITAAICYAAQMLGFRRLQRNYAIPVYMAYVWLGAGLLIGVAFIRSTEHLTLPNLLPLLAGAIGSWAGMYCVNKAVHLQPNLGYVGAVGTMRLGLIYSLSVVFFDASFEPIKLIFVAGSAIGVVLIIGLKKESARLAGKSWAAWILLSILCFSMMFVCIRTVTAQGTDARTGTALLMLMAGAMYVASALRGGHSLRPAHDWPAILVTIAFSAIGNAAFFSSLTSAPNLAYTDAIVNLRIVILYMAALVIGADRLQPLKALGVAITFGCAALLG
jgi:drug/metabolite transporter (DMT)-like permease